MFFLMTIESDEDRNKITLLHKQYYKLMFDVAFAIIHDSHLAEDIISESFYRIMNNLDKVEDIESSRTRNFLCLICRNVAIDFYNKRKKIYNHEDFDEITIEKMDAKENPENIVITKDTCKKLKEIIHNLDDKYKDVIELKIGYKMKRADIARIFGVPEETIKKRLYRARCMIWDAYQKWEVESK